MRGGPIVALFAVLTIVLAVAAAHFEVHELVYDISTPAFETAARPPLRDSLAAFETHLHRPNGHEWFRQLAPNQGGALWIGLLVTVAACGLGSRRGVSPRLRDLLFIQLTAWLLFGSLDLFEQTPEPLFLGWIQFTFELAGLALAVVWLRTFWLQSHPFAERWVPSLGLRSLKGLALVLVVLNLAVIFASAPDDSSVFANLGGQRLRERGRLPYGDPMLTGTPAAAYPPLLYALHSGVQAVIAAPINQPIEDRPRLGPASNYWEPPRVVSQLVLAGAHLAGISALYLIGAGQLGGAGGWALVALYAGSPYLLDMGGTRESASGLTFVSHIVPAAATLFAFACLGWPLTSGALLAIATGLGFYPVFFFPIWASWQWRQSRRAALQFGVGFAAVSIAIGAWVLMRSTPVPGLTLVGTIVRDTLGHHTDPAGYGLSRYGLWGQQTGLIGWLGHPLLAGRSWTTPFFVLFAASIAAAASLARRADLARLALLTAGAAIGVNLWKIHATGTYVTWYYPFLLLGLLGVSDADREDA